MASSLLGQTYILTSESRVKIYAYSTPGDDDEGDTTSLDGAYDAYARASETEAAVASDYFKVP